MVGLNDVNFGSKSAEAIAEDLITLAGAVKDSCPSAKVYILSLLPVTSGLKHVIRIKSHSLQLMM